MARSLASLLALVLALGCSSRPRDVAGARRDASTEDGGGAHSLPAPPPPPEAKPPTFPKARVIARATSRVLAVDGTNLYFSDQTDDTLYALSQNGGEPVRLARRAPVAGALAIDGEWIAWIASPGDTVLRLTLLGFGVTTLREHGIFSDVALAGGEVFATEVAQGGGTLTKLGIDGKTTTKLATFETPPRAVLVDATHVYVQLTGAIVRTPRTKGPVEVLATGTGIESPQLDAGFVYFVQASGETANIVRVPKAGGASSVVVKDVRAAPIEIAGDEVLFFDRARPALAAASAAGGTPRVLAEDEMLARPSALVADGEAAYVAVEDGAVLAVRRK